MVVAYPGVFVFVTASTPTEMYTLSLHDALPIYENASSQESVPIYAPFRRHWHGLASPTVRQEQHLTNSPLPFFEMPFRAALNRDRKSTRLNSSHGYISYAAFCLKKRNHGASPGP